MKLNCAGTAKLHQTATSIGCLFCASGSSRLGSGMNSYNHRSLAGSAPSNAIAGGSSSHAGGPAQPPGPGASNPAQSQASMPVNSRLTDLLEFVRQEFDSVAIEAQNLKLQNIEYETHGAEDELSAHL